MESRAQLTQSYSNPFNSSSSVASWLYWYDIVNNTGMTWDSTTDAGGNTNSGSLEVSIPWVGTGDQQLWFGTWDNAYGYDTSLTMIGTYITNISCDIHVDPSSPLDANGDFGTINIGFYPGPVLWAASSVTLPASASNGWMHVSIPVDTTTPGLASVSGICFQMATYSAPLSGTSLFWIDNLDTTATPNYTNSFDTSAATKSWIYWYGLNPGNSAIPWDGTTDANGDTNSGSMEITLDWQGTNNPSGAGQQQAMFGSFANRYGYDGGETTDANAFENIVCAIHVDPSSPTNAGGNYGQIQIGFMNEWSSITWSASVVTLYTNAASGWTNIVVPIDHTTAGLNSGIAGIFIGMNTYGGSGGGLPGTTQFWVDDLGVVAASAPLPAPTLGSLQTPVQGLNMTPSLQGPGDLDDRYNIMTDNETNLAAASVGNGNLYSWVGAGGPVTYSITLNEFPGQSASGFQQQIFMCPGAVGSEVDPDWQEPNCIFITVQYEPIATNTYITNGITITTNTTTNWMGVMDFQYKTNLPNGNGMIYNKLALTNVANTNLWPVEPVGQVMAPLGVGTWSVTFNQNTNVTLTSASGATTNFTIPAASAALFADPLTIYVGVQPNVAGGFEQLCNATQFSITGSGTALSDDFLADTSLNTNIWQIDAQDPNAIVLVPADQAFWLAWSIPDTGFYLQTSSTLGATNWTYLTGTNASAGAVTALVQQGGQRKALIPDSSLPSAVTGFFRLIQNQ